MAPHTLVRVSARAAIEADNLVKRFGETLAVDGVSLSVPEGTVLGLFGPNGAGKTTMVRMMTTLTTPTSGTARVAGYDVVEQPDMVRKSMGLTGQAATVDELLTGPENLRLIGSLYGLSSAYVRQASERPARAVLAQRRRQPDREDLLRGHAAAPRPRGQPDRHAAGALPRRADHRPRPAQPGGALGRAPRPRVGRHDLAAHDAVPRGGRPARRPDRGDRPRPRDRGGDAARAQGPVGQGRARGDRVRGR